MEGTEWDTATFLAIRVPKCDVYIRLSDDPNDDIILASSTLKDVCSILQRMVKGKEHWSGDRHAGKPTFKIQDPDTKENAVIHGFSLQYTADCDPESQPTKDGDDGNGAADVDDEDNRDTGEAAAPQADTEGKLKTRAFLLKAGVRTFIDAFFKDTN
jgi:hypothetical protein